VSVIILGMHRSGTSAVTRAVSLLGLSMCRPEHLLRGHAGNERGHWECAPLVTENEHLLEALASRWWCPPDGSAEVAAFAEDPTRVATARAAFTASHPSDPWVWKDPRTSLLVPFWRRALPVEPVAILVCRRPSEIAASMLARDRITPAFTLALWERHMRLAVEGCRGRPLLVTNYADLITDPLAWCSRTCQFLNQHGVEATPPADPAGIRAFLSPGLWHRRPRSDDLEDGLNTDQQHLWAWLQEHASAPVTDPTTQLPLGGEAAVTLMREVRRAFSLTEGVTTPAGASFVSAFGVRVLEPRTTVPRIPKPRVSVLFLPRGRAATVDEAGRLRPRLPADADIITVVTPSDGDSWERPTRSAPAWFIRARRERPLTLAQRLNTAAEIARGQLLVIFAGPPITLLPGWLPALRPVLDRPDCAVVSPAIHASEGDDPVYGLAPSDLLLTADWISKDSSGEPFPIPAASIAAMLTTRRAFEGVGGFDEGLTGGGGEDVDYCLRLWRAGWRCLAVPGARVRMRFETLPAADVDVMANTLRLGMVHLDAGRLAEQLKLLAPSDCFAEALSGVSAGDVGRRRRVVEALSWYETALLPASLGVDLVSAADG
jgi:hypothetical protein